MTVKNNNLHAIMRFSINKFYYKCLCGEVVSKLDDMSELELRNEFYRSVNYFFTNF